MSKKGLGLVSVSFRGHSPAEILEAMKDTGLTCIEWGSDIHAPKDDIKRLEELCALQKEYGVECCSYGTYFRLGETPLGELHDYINAARLLGTDILRLWCGNKNSEEYGDGEKRALFDECKAAARIAEEEGVTLCMECHNGTYTNRKEAALELMEAVASDVFRMYWQPNQFRSVDENLRYAKLLSPYIVNLHVFNWEGKNKYPLAEAVDTWKVYLKNTGTKTMLLEFMPDGKIESLKTEAASLRKIAEE